MGRSSLSRTRRILACTRPVPVTWLTLYFCHAPNCGQLRGVRDIGDEVYEHIVPCRLSNIPTREGMNTKHSFWAGVLKKAKTTTERFPVWTSWGISGAAEVTYKQIWRNKTDVVSA